jgi:prepilin-type N-terminal cleavage/methylation domain-containing protein
METKKGFTLLELIVVMMIALSLMGIAVRGVGGMRSRTSVLQARNVYVGLHARARAQAVEFAQRTQLWIAPDGDSIWISRNDTILQTVHFGRDMGIQIETGADQEMVCMNARGFADPRCNSFGGTLTLTFVQGRDTTFLTVLPLGQVVF